MRGRLPVMFMVRFLPSCVRSSSTDLVHHPGSYLPMYSVIPSPPVYVEHAHKPGFTVAYQQHDMPGLSCLSLKPIKKYLKLVKTSLQ